MIIFPDLPDIQVEEVEGAFEITLTLRTTSPMAPCPSCGTQSSHIQSRYTRTLRDLPAAPSLLPAATAPVPHDPHSKQGA